MLIFSLVCAGLLLLWMALTWVTLPGGVGYLQRVIASAYAIEVAIVGVAVSVVGVVVGSLPVAVAFAAVAVVAGIPVLRVWRAPDAVRDAMSIGAALPAAGRFLLRRRWGLSLGAVPAARVERDLAFATPPGSRPLLCDLWQPPLGVAPSGLAFIYLHGSAWVVLDKDVGTRTLFGRLAAQGHVVMDVAYRLFPETDIEGMVGDVRRSIAWMKAHAAAYGVDPARVVVGGGSAGAHLAMLTAYTEGLSALTPPDLYVAATTNHERRRIDTSVVGVVAWYGPVDLRACYTYFHNDRLRQDHPEQPNWAAPPPPWMVRVMGKNARRLGLQQMGSAGGAGRLDFILAGTPDEVPERYALLSPCTHVRADCPPTLLMQGPSTSSCRGQRWRPCATGCARLAPAWGSCCCPAPTTPSTSSAPAAPRRRGARSGTPSASSPTSRARPRRSAPERQ